MIRIRYFISFIFLLFSFHSVSQDYCGLTIDTTTNALEEKAKLKSFLSELQTKSFQNFTDKNQLPEAITKQLTCLFGELSLANPNENWQCCCASPDSLPRRKLLFFSQSEDVFVIAYLTGGIGVSTNIHLFKHERGEIKDLWLIYTFSEPRSVFEMLNQFTRVHTGIILHATMDSQQDVNVGKNF